MADKKVLMLYYSRSGTTRKVAEAIAALLGCDVEEILDRKDRSGVTGYLVSLKDSALRKPAEIEPVRRDPADYDLVVIGTPVWGFSVCGPVRTYLVQHEGRLGEVAFFCTRMLLGARRAMRHMAELCGGQPRAVLALRMGEVSKGDPRGKIQAFVEALRG